MLEPAPPHGRDRTKSQPARVVELEPLGHTPLPLTARFAVRSARQRAARPGPGRRIVGAARSRGCARAAEGAEEGSREGSACRRGDLGEGGDRGDRVGEAAPAPTPMRRAGGRRRLGSPAARAGPREPRDRVDHGARGQQSVCQPHTARVDVRAACKRPSARIALVLDPRRGPCSRAARAGRAKARPSLRQVDGIDVGELCARPNKSIGNCRVRPGGQRGKCPPAVAERGIGELPRSRRRGSAPAPSASPGRRACTPRRSADQLPRGRPRARHLRSDQAVLKPSRTGRLQESPELARERRDLIADGQG